MAGIGCLSSRLVSSDHAERPAASLQVAWREGLDPKHYLDQSRATVSTSPCEVNTSEVRVGEHCSLEVDMDFSVCVLYSQPLIPREVLWFMSTKDELRSQQWSQDMTISVTENAQTDENHPFSGAT